MVNTQRLSMSM